MIEGNIKIGDQIVLPADLFSGEEFVVVSGRSKEHPPHLFLVGSAREEWWRPEEKIVREECRRPHPDELPPLGM